MSIVIVNKLKNSTTNQISKPDHGAWHMANDPLYFEPMRKNTFEFIALGLEGLTKAGMLPTESNSKLSGTSTKSAEEALRLSVSSSSVPSFSQQAISVKRGNTEVKYAGTPSYKSGSISVYDFIGLETREILYAWQALAFNVRTEKVGVGQDYKKTCYLLEYTPDYQLIRTWRLQGCWISEISEEDFNWEDDGIKKISVTIEYDYAVLERDE